MFAGLFAQVKDSAKDSETKTSESQVSFELAEAQVELAKAQVELAKAKMALAEAPKDVEVPANAGTQESQEPPRVGDILQGYTGRVGRNHRKTQRVV